MMCSPTRVIVDADVDVDLGSKLVHPSKNFSELLALEGGNLFQAAVARMRAQRRWLAASSDYTYDRHAGS